MVVNVDVVESPNLRAKENVEQSDTVSIAMQLLIGMTVIICNDIGILFVSLKTVHCRSMHCIGLLYPAALLSYSEPTGGRNSFDVIDLFYFEVLVWGRCANYIEENLEHVLYG